MIDTALLDEIRTGKKAEPVDYLVPDTNTAPPIPTQEQPVRKSSINLELLNAIKSGEHQDIIDNTAKATSEPVIIRSEPVVPYTGAPPPVQIDQQTQSILNQEQGGLGGQLLAKANSPELQNRMAIRKKVDEESGTIGPIDKSAAGSPDIPYRNEAPFKTGAKIAAHYGAAAVSGLGLTIPDVIAKKLTGELTLESAVDKATGFAPNEKEQTATPWIKIAPAFTTVGGLLGRLAPLAKSATMIDRVGRAAQIGIGVEAANQVSQKINDNPEYRGAVQVMETGAVVAGLSLAGEAAGAGFNAAWNKLYPSERVAALRALGLGEKDLSVDKIRSAAQQEAFKYHPDKVQGMTDEFNKVIAARDNLYKDIEQNIIVKGQGQKPSIPQERGNLLPGEVTPANTDIKPQNKVTPEGAGRPAQEPAPTPLPVESRATVGQIKPEPSPVSDKVAGDTITREPTGEAAAKPENVYTGPAYRVDTGFRPRGTAADVVRYERDELGNDISISPEKLKELESYDARDIVWVGRNKEDVVKYAQADVGAKPKPKDYKLIGDETDAVQGGEIIAEDGDGGYLVLRKQPPASTEGGKTAEKQASKPVRFEAGKNLTKEQKSEVLKSIGDSYKDLNAPKTTKGFYRESGDEITGYEYNPEYMHTSDITGRKIRHYVTLPDGRKAHPTELFPNIKQSEVNKAIIESRNADKQIQARKEELIDVSKKATSLNEANAIAGQRGLTTSPDYDKSVVLQKDNNFIRVLSESDVDLLKNEGYEEIIRAGQKATSPPPAEKQAWEMTKEEYAKTIEPRYSGRLDMSELNRHARAQVEESNRLQNATNKMVADLVKKGNTQEEAWKVVEQTPEWKRFTNHEELYPFDTNKLQDAITNHKDAVKQAVSESKPVPRAVLEEYKSEPWASSALAKQGGEGKDIYTLVEEDLFNNIIKSAADNPKELRASDIERVFREADDQAKAKQFGEWLLKQDLSDRTRKRLLENPVVLGGKTVWQPPAKAAEGAKADWQKVPSVRPGGKDYFYVTQTPIGKRSIVWDRQTESYAVQDEQHWDGKQYVHDIDIPVKSIEAGKKLVEQQISEGQLKLSPEQQRGFEPDPTSPDKAKGAPGFAGVASNRPGGETTKPWLDMEKTKSPDADIENFFGRTQRLPYSKKVSKLLDRIKEGLRERFVPRHLLSNTPENAIYHDMIRTMPEERRAAGDKAIRDIVKVLDNDGTVQALDSAGFDLLRRKVFTQDILHEAEIDRSVAGNLKLDQLKAENKRLDDLIEQVPSVKKAYEARQKLWKDVSADLVERGVLDEETAKNQAYVRHFVLDLAEKNRPTGFKRKRLSEPYRAYSKQRKGSHKDISTDYLAVEVRALSDIYMDNAVEDMANKVGELADKRAYYKDLAKTHNAENPDNPTTPEKLALQDDYVEWHYKRPNIFYRASTMNEAKVAALVENMAEDAGGMIQIPASEMRSALVMGGKRKGMLLPKELAAQLDDLPVNKRTNLVVESFSKPFVQFIKRWYLRTNPLRYNFRNMLGDTEGVNVAGQTAALKKIPEAMKLLFTKTGEEYEILQKYGGAGSSLWNEMGDYSKLPEFEKFRNITKQKDFVSVTKAILGTPLRMIKGVGNIEQTLTQLREDILRTAVFLHNYEKLKAGESVRHWAGNKANVMEIAKTDPGRAAVKISRETLGDYGNFTPFENNALRQGLVPFYSWMKINAMRWPTVVKNSAAEGLAGKTIALGAAKLGLNVGLWTVRAMAVYGAAYLWNHRDDEAQNKEASLPFWLRAQPHVNIANKTIWGQTSLSDFAEWGDAEELSGVLWRHEAGFLNNKETALEAAKVIAKAPVEKIYQALNPYLKAPIVGITGVETHPSVFKPHYVAAPASKESLKRVALDIMGADAKKFYQSIAGEKAFNDTLYAYFAGWFARPIAPDAMIEQIERTKEWTELKKDSKTTNRYTGEAKKGKESEWQENQIREKAVKKQIGEVVYTGKAEIAGKKIFAKEDLAEAEKQSRLLIGEVDPKIVSFYTKLQNARRKDAQKIELTDDERVTLILSRKYAKTIKTLKGNGDKQAIIDFFSGLN